MGRHIPRLRSAVLCTVALGVGVVCMAGAKYSTGYATATCQLTRESVLLGPQRLYAVALIGRGSVVAVGSRRAAHSDHSLVERWNHNRWTRMPTPDIGLLGDVSATARSNIWTAAARALLHWNGTKWLRIALPNASHLPGFAGQIAATRSGLWAIGASSVGRWNGKRWQTWSDRNVNVNYGGLSAISDRDVWLGGNDAAGPLVMHWDGRSWQHVQAPADPGLVILAIDAKSDDQVWIAGYHADENDHWTGVVEEWDGSTWHDLDQPQIADPYGVDDQVSYTAISAVDAKSAWVGGGAGEVPLTILASAPGSIMPPEPRPLSAVIYDIDAVDATTAWAVAFDSKSSVVERVQCDQ
jgi:hypothetical protein